jgi:hypothetical protein
MKTKVLLAAIGGAIASFLLGWLVYGLILMDYYTSHMTSYEGLTKDPPALWAIFMGGLCWSLLVAWLWDKMGTNTIMQGFINGAVFSLLISLTFDLYIYANMNLYQGTVLVVDVIVGTIFGAIVAAIIAWILGMGKKESPETA